ncbi:MAG: hypothetical protein OMM_06713 [Candidatus Magnetoglobus multicellularis str. Araruama]|uniref:Uncharacterized protein n=1 Tax=Candidatus Magnetoglobus multicellularis str. Araruama TaxID=890399 RepID=A0A1V1PGA3_9BACT|nr:MAG: hypothetical protein OMM_06713 [Candidatus Magnetoglobus multicellularis str. Araruama]
MGASLLVRPLLISQLTRKDVELVKKKEIDPYQNIPKGLSDQGIWNAMNKRIDEIDSIRRSIRKQLHLATAKNKQDELIQLKDISSLLLEERVVLNNEMKQIKQRIKQKSRGTNDRPQETLALAFMMIAQKKLPQAVFANIRDEAAMKIVLHKA